jgi:hypothetical protein
VYAGQDNSNIIIPQNHSTPQNTVNDIIPIRAGRGVGRGEISRRGEITQNDDNAVNTINPIRAVGGVGRGEIPRRGPNTE